MKPWQYKGIYNGWASPKLPVNINCWNDLRVIFSRSDHVCLMFALFDILRIVLWLLWAERPALTFEIQRCNWCVLCRQPYGAFLTVWSGAEIDVTKSTAEKSYTVICFLTNFDVSMRDHVGENWLYEELEDTRYTYMYDVPILLEKRVTRLHNLNFNRQEYHVQWFLYYT